LALILIAIRSRAISSIDLDLEARSREVYRSSASSVKKRRKREPIGDDKNFAARREFHRRV